jgi:hypothetical protein
VVVDQLGQHVVLRFLQKALDEVGHVGGQCGRTFLALLLAGLPFFGGGVGAHVRTSHEVEDPAVEGGFVLQRDTEDLADDGDRNRIGVVIDDVKDVAALGFDLVQ